MMKFKLTIDSSIEYNEVTEFFEEVSEKIVGSSYIGLGWQVIINKLKPRRHGVIELPRTLLEFSGNQESCESIVLKYRKKFMRGGG